jgi:hypothetical protein
MGKSLALLSLVLLPHDQDRAGTVGRWSSFSRDANQSVGYAQGVETHFRCPHCHALVGDRRSPVCTTCKQALPAERVMTPDQVAKTAALDQMARTQHAESMKSLQPLKNFNPDAPVIMQILTTSVDAP